MPSRAHAAATESRNMAQAVDCPYVVGNQKVRIIIRAMTTLGHGYGRHTVRDRHFDRSCEAARVLRYLEARKVRYVGRYAATQYWEFDGCLIDKDGFVRLVSSRSEKKKRTTRY